MKQNVKTDTSQSVSGREKALKLVEFVLETKAVRPVVLDVRNASSLCDYFVVCSAESHQQVRAIHEKVLRRCKNEDYAIDHYEVDEALKWAQKIEDLTEAHGELPAQQQGELYRFQGVLLMQQGELEQSQEALELSLVVFQNLRSRLNLGRTYFQLGRLATAQGNTTEANHYYVEAENIFREIGASLDADHAKAAQL